MSLFENSWESAIWENQTMGKTEESEETKGKSNFIRF